MQRELNDNPHAFLDITGEVCPMTYVRVKLALERLAGGEVLEVLLRGEEPLRNVPESAREEGHQILSIEPADGAVRMRVRKRC